jgi:hypothetical protein
LNHTAEQHAKEIRPMNEPLAEALVDKATASELRALADDLDSIAKSLAKLADAPTARAADILIAATHGSSLAETLRKLAVSNFLVEGEQPERVGG